MSKLEFKNILHLFGGGELSDEEKQDLFVEALLMTLARATSSDTNIEPVEVETVGKIILDETGTEIETARIRVAAASELFETQPLEKYLSKTSHKLPESDRIRIVRALARVIKSDVRVSATEIEFFNMVASALHVSPAGLAGLSAD